jgi:iron complex transport system permease protein
MRRGLVLVGASVALAGVFFVSALIGAAHISAGDVFFALFHPFSSSVDARILWEIRMPRICSALVVGGALGIAGSVLQTLLRNPIVDSSITGVSAGASLSIAIGVALGVPIAYLPAAGTITGLATAFVVFALALRGGRIDTLRLILAGVFVSAFLGAIVNLMLLRLKSVYAAQSILVWLNGSLAGHGWTDIAVALPYAAAGLVLLAFAIRGLNALRLGETRAASVGAPVARTHALVVVGATLLTSAAVSLAGIVGFVGLLAPHVARRFVGNDVRWNVPLAALVGAMLVSFADVVARTAVPPVELPIGALLSLFGVPALFVILRREERSRTPSAAALPIWRYVFRLRRNSA